SPTRETAPVDSHLNWWRCPCSIAPARVLTGGRFCCHTLRLVVDIAIGWVAILIAQRECPQRHRRRQPPLRGDAVVRPFCRREDDVAAVGGPDRVVLRVEEAVVGDVALFAAGDWRNVDMRANGAVLFREGDP